MSSIEFKNTVCRICLDENVVLNWNDNLAGHCNITYRDCYYKYTQLKTVDADPFSSMLCQNCSSSLCITHALILKALDSYNFLLEVNCINSEMEDSSITEDCANYTSTDEETMLVENDDTQQLEDEYDNFDTINESDSENEHEECEFDESIQLYNNDVSNSYNSLCISPIKYNSSKGNSVKEDATCYNRSANKKLETTHNNTSNEKRSQNKKLENQKLEETNEDSRAPKRRKGKKYKMKNTPSMCSFCSKILHSKYSLQKHEKTHLDNRERKASCPICGVKFFEEAYVKSHMQIHNDNRIKKHKCEFCDKAFFEKGALNVHRRIHLGQMKTCNLCSKEFYRQVDLDIHMNSHSATIINVKTKKKSKYWVHCKYCKKNVISTSFKSHTAVHLNEPLMKCSICDKDFYRRDSCVQHVKTIHKKTSEEYNDFIILYNKNRLSHLYLEQTTEIKLKEN